jgi:type II secretory pathway pseudopilin PulG
MTRCSGAARGHCRGFMYFSVLWLVAMVAIGLLVVAESYVVTEQREKERELILIGREFAEAIRRYADLDLKLAAGARRYPAELDELVEDRRGTGEPRRHLRRIYRDPVTGSTEWGIVRINGGIVAVHSLSNRKPLKVRGFDSDQSHLEERLSYSEWLFGDTQSLPLPSTGGLGAR